MLNGLHGLLQIYSIFVDLYFEKEKMFNQATNWHNFKPTTGFNAPVEGKNIILS